MSWPIFSDYQTAIQNPPYCFSDHQLKHGIPDLTPIGLPKSNSGNFAVVFPIVCGGRRWAVRCFNKQQIDREHRYDLISKYLGSTKLPWMANFLYMKQGIKVNSGWFPAIKMEWVEGEPLDNYVKRNLGDPDALLHLAHSFADMVQGLQNNRIAHGDLQHRNILVADGKIRLVDYDGMFVPGLEGLTCCEGGHPNYQSPLRSDNDLALYLDNFSSWVIYLSLVACAADRGIWDLNKGNDEALLFNKDDFQFPEISQAFQRLGTVKNHDVMQITAAVKTFACLPPSEVPALNLKNVPAITKGITKIPDWLTPYISIPDINNKQPWTEQLVVLEPISEQILGALPKISSDLNLQALSEDIVQVDVSPMVQFSFRLTMIIMSAATIIANLYGAPVLMIMIALDVLALGVWTAWTIDRYLSLPELKRKLAIKKEAQELNDALDTAKISKEESREQISTILESERKQFNALTSRFDSCSKKSRTDFENCQRELKDKRTQIAEERKSISESVSSDIKQQLRKLRVDSLSRYLSNTSIEKAGVPGIGPTVSEALSKAGIRTAADFRDINFITAYYRNNPGAVAYFVLNSGQNVRIPLVGPKKAAALRQWRRMVESKYEQKLPTALPIEEQQAIRSQAADKLKRLSAEENRVKLDFEKREKEILTTCLKAHEEIRRQVPFIRMKTLKSLEEKRNEVINILESTSRLAARLETKRLELDTYDKVTLGTFMKNFLIG